MRYGKHQRLRLKNLWHQTRKNIINDPLDQGTLATDAISTACIDIVQQISISWLRLTSPILGLYRLFELFDLMLHPFQAICTIRKCATVEHEYVIAACGPRLFCIQGDNGEIKSQWAAKDDSLHVTVSIAIFSNLCCADEISSGHQGRGRSRATRQKTKGRKQHQ